MSDSLWSDYRDDALAPPPEDVLDERCWACMRRSGKVPGGRVPLCLRHYVKLRLRYPSLLLDNEDGRR